MNFSQLECFVSLASTLNFMQTAEQLSLTQPAVSKQLKALENEVHAELLTRTSRSVTLTPQGAEFLVQVKEILRLYYHALELINSYDQRQTNKLRIGYADPQLMALFGELFKRCSQKFGLDSISPEFVCDQTDANLSRLKKSQLDVLIGMRDARFDDSDIIFKKLRENDFKCVLPRTHPLATRKLGEVADTKDYATITTEELWPYRQILMIPHYLLKNFYSRGLRILPVNDTLDNLICSTASEAYALVRAGFGYAMVPEFLLQEHEDVLTLNWQESPHAPFGVYYRRHRDRHGRLEDLLVVLGEMFASGTGQEGYPLRGTAL